MIPRVLKIWREDPALKIYRHTSRPTKQQARWWMSADHNYFTSCTHHHSITIDLDMPLLHHRHRIHRRRPIITFFFILFIFTIGTAIPVVDAFGDRHINLQHSATVGGVNYNPKLFISSHHQSMTKMMTSTIDDNNCIDSSTLTQIKAGFIGCGTIASSIATALATPSHSTILAQHAGLSLHSISVTKRSESKSSKLKQSFPDMVTIYDSASDVVQNSDVVFLCVLPEQVDEVLDELKKANVWRQADHILVSLVVGPLLL
jgi:hypothetical protein